MKLKFFMAPSKARFIEATGVGETDEAALTESFRNAVIKAGLLTVSARQKLTDGELSYDEVATEANAYIDTYQVLATGKDPKTGKRKRKIKARIIPFSPNAKTKYVTPPAEVVRCKKCRGEGHVKFDTTCGKCTGSGLLPDVTKRGLNGREYTVRGGNCPICKGKGTVEHSEICRVCHGKRTVRVDDVIEED